MLPRSFLLKVKHFQFLNVLEDIRYLELFAISALVCGENALALPEVSKSGLNRIFQAWCEQGHTECLEGKISISRFFIC